MLIDIIEKEQVQQMTVNGVTRELKVKFCEISCPNCKMVINQVQGSHLDVWKLLSIEQNQALNYCPNCSTKFDYPCIIEGEAKVIDIL